MRVLTLLMFILLSFGCEKAKKADAGAFPLDGVWIPIKEEMSGATFTPGYFAKQKLTMADSNYTYLADKLDKGICVYNNGKMDIYGKEGPNTGKHFKAIYKQEKDLLTICYNLTGEDYPDSLATQGKPRFFLVTYKKG